MFLAILVCCSIFPKPGYSREDAVALPDIVVEGKFEEEDFVGPLFTETYTKTKITEKRWRSREQGVRSHEYRRETRKLWSSRSIGTTKATIKKRSP